MFHWVCLDKYARSLPNDTAPAGYTCPICNECIFPLDNLVSPVADALRGLLSDVNWARAGLGLPLLEERREKKPEFSIPSSPLDVELGFFLELSLSEALVFLEKKVKLLEEKSNLLTEQSLTIKANIKLILHGLREIQGLSADDLNRPIYDPLQ